MHRTLGIGICGGGGIARQHIKGYRQVDNVRLVCIADPDVDRASQLAKEFAIPRVVEDAREMFAMPEVDAVSVCTPNLYHCSLSVDACNAGKHVLCEKPLAANAHDAQAIVDAAQANKKVLMVALNNRFAANSRALKAVVDEGALGHIHYGKAWWLRRHGIPGAGGWFTTKRISGGGPLIDIGVHVIDLALFMMGYPEPVAVTGSTYDVFGSRGLGASPVLKASERQRTGVFDVEDLAVGMVKLADGATLVVEASWAGHQEREDDIGIQLFGRDGGARMWMPDYETGESVHVYTEAKGEIADFAPCYTVTDAYATEIQHFVDCIRMGWQPRSPGEHGVTLLRIIDALYESAATGHEVRLDEPAPSR